MGFDFSISESGDLILNDKNDIMKSSYDNLRIQRLICAIKSISNDWYGDNIGANLEQYLGESLNQELVGQIVDSIYFAAISTNIIRKEEVYVIPNVVNTNIELSIFLKKTNGNSSYLIKVNFDMVSGVNINLGTS